MTFQDKRVGFGAFPVALLAALQWRLLLLWTLCVLAVTCIALWPLRAVLGELLDQSVHAGEWARGFHALPMFDLLTQAGKQGAAINGGTTAAAILLLVLAPFLTAMVIASLRAKHALGLQSLLHGGLGDYWRMLRLKLWSLLPYGIAIGISAAAFAIAKKSAATAVLETVADRNQHIVLCLAVVLLVLAHAIMEAARAQFAADPAMRSATRALGRGARMLLRRPLATLGLYLATSIVGYVLLLFIGMARIHVAAVGAGAWLAFVLAVLLIAVLAWQRIARLHALTALARISGKR